MTDSTHGGWQDESTAAVRPPARRLRVDHTHARHQRRIARAVADRLSRVLTHDEQVLAFTEGIIHSGLLPRAVLGPMWAPSRRVALLFTDRRLVEIGMSSSGRRSLGPIRAFPWDVVPGFDLAGGVLELRTWSEVSFRWYLRDDIDDAVAEKLHDRVDLSVSTYRPSEDRSVPVRFCSHCCAPRPDPERGCSRCGDAARSPRLAGVLAVAWPGAGHLYGNRPLAAAYRFLLELLVLAGFTIAVLGASTLREATTVLAAFAVVFTVLKLHGAAAARLLVARAGTVSRRARRRWQLLVPAGAVASLAALVVPLSLIGAADTDVSWDLDFLSAGPDWTGQRVADFDEEGSVRSRWLHDDGLEAWVQAWPFERFESAAAARSRLERVLEGASRQLGPHQAITSARPFTTPQGARRVRVEVTVIDDEGRDIHVLHADVQEELAAVARNRLDWLAARGVWVPTTDPLGGK